MNIRKHPKPASSSPRTRRELLQHVWAHPDLQDTNVFKEGPFYAARKGRIVSATHLRTIDAKTYDGWLQLLRSIPVLTVS